MVQGADDIIEYAVDLAMDLSYKDLTPASVEKMKLVILDSIGVALGGIKSQSARITKETFSDDGTDSSLWGFNSKGSDQAAILINGVSLRFLDYLEYFNVPTPKGIPQIFHISEVLPLIFAIGEKEKLPGEEILTSFYLASELSGKLCASVGSISLAERGFHHSTLGYIIAPLVAGRLLGLSRDEMVNAVSLGALNSTLGIVDAEGEAYYMSKNFAFPFSNFIGYRYTLMARNGFNSSPRVLTGNKGFIKTVLHDDESTENFYKSPENGWISRDSIKLFPVCGAAQSIAESAMEIGREENLNTDGIKKVTISANKRSAGHVGDPAKRHPRDKETADHSASFIVALGLLKKSVSPLDFNEENYLDPSINSLEDRIAMEHGTEFDDPTIYPAAQVTVETDDGQVYTRKSIHPLGHYANPVGQDEVTRKFRQVSTGAISEQEMDAIINHIGKLEKLGSLRELKL